MTDITWNLSGEGTATGPATRIEGVATLRALWSDEEGVLVEVDLASADALPFTSALLLADAIRRLALIPPPT